MLFRSLIEASTATLVVGTTLAVDIPVVVVDTVATAEGDGGDSREPFMLWEDMSECQSTFYSSKYKLLNLLSMSWRILREYRYKVREAHAGVLGCKHPSGIDVQGD